MRIDRAHQTKRRQWFFDIDMRPHAQRVDARICTARTIYERFLTRCFENGFFDRTLYGWTVVLPLPAHIGPAVEFDGERKSGHARIVPCAMGLPRNRSAVGMAGFPAR